MIGASAGVMSVLFYLASYSPQMGIRIFFFDIKIIYIALFLFFYDIIQIPLIILEVILHIEALFGDITIASVIIRGKTLFILFLTYLRQPKRTTLK